MLFEKDEHDRIKGRTVIGKNLSLSKQRQCGQGLRTYWYSTREWNDTGHSGRGKQKKVQNEGSRLLKLKPQMQPHCFCACNSATVNRDLVANCLICCWDFGFAQVHVDTYTHSGNKLCSKCSFPVQSDFFPCPMYTCSDEKQIIILLNTRGQC